MMRLLFVCSGNTCRSPMAAALARERFRALGLDGTAASAGMNAWPGSPATKEAGAEMARRGLSLADHRASPLEEAALLSADWVLTMTAAQRDGLRGRFPRLAPRILTLGEAAGEPADVADPYGGGAALYRACAGQLERLVERAVTRLAR